MTDATLLKESCRRRAGSAFEDLIDRHGPMVHRTCLDILGGSEDAMDAAQATFLVFIRRAGSIRDEASTGRWLYEVARRVAWRERLVPTRPAGERPGGEGEFVRRGSTKFNSTNPKFFLPLGIGIMQ